jgi:hypothetical protein
VGNLGGFEAEEIAAHGYEWSVAVNVPPLATLVLAPGPGPVAVREETGTGTPDVDEGVSEEGPMA